MQYLYGYLYKHTYLSYRFSWPLSNIFIGGILCYLDFIVLVSKWPLKNHCGVDSTYVYYVFLFLLLIILLWYTSHITYKEDYKFKIIHSRWVFGFGRIFSGSMNEEPIMSEFFKEIEYWQARVLVPVQCPDPKSKESYPKKGKEILDSEMTLKSY